MKNLERSEFDEQWKVAFEGAEVSPVASIWSNLDRELTLAEGNEMKQRIVFYQRLAAACVLFALLSGSFGVYHWQQSSNQVSEGKVTQQSSDPTQASQPAEKNDLATNKNSETINNSASESKVGNSQKTNRLQSANENSQRIVKSDRNSFRDRNGLSVPNEEGIQTDSSMREKLSKKNSEWYSANLSIPDPALLPFDSVDGEPTFVDIKRKLPFVSSAYMDKNKKENFNHEKIWASVVAAAGTYSDHNGGSSYSMSSAFSAQPGSSAPTGNSYTVGMLGGFRIAKRWVLQSGVQYMNQSAGYTSNVSALSLYDLANFAKAPATAQNTGNISSSTPYSVMSTNEFVSLPVQAGYLLVDKKIGWQINPGMAADFFVRNTLSDPSGQKQSYSQGTGSESPYRLVNFAGLMSSEVSYKLGKSYRVSLVPGLRYSFNPVLKSQTTGNPFIWDMGFRFRYIFK